MDVKKIVPLNTDVAKLNLLDFSNGYNGSVPTNGGNTLVDIVSLDTGEDSFNTVGPGPVADGRKFYLQEDGSVVNSDGVSYDEYASNLSDNYIIDENGYVSLVNVHPELKVKMRELIDACESEGINIRITQDLRSVSEQDALYSQGRDGNEGSVVTNAKGSDYASNHQWGVAFDVCINDSNDAYNIDLLERVGEIGKSIGLEWGGDWTDFPDYPHFQLEGCSSIREIYDTPADFVNDNWGDAMFSDIEN